MTQDPQTKNLPVDPGPLTYWISFDGERFQPGGYTMDEAIEEALATECYQEIEPEKRGKPWRARFYVAKYRKRVIDLSLFFNVDDWFSLLEDAFEDELSGDEDGNHFPLEEISKSAKYDLEASIRSAIWHFQNRRQLKLSPFWLEGDDYHQEITIDLPDHP